MKYLVKYCRPLLAVILTSATLSLFIFVGMASASPVTHRCISHWHVVASAKIQNDLQNVNVGMVSLLRDGCGNIQATLCPSVATTSMFVYLSDASGKTIGVDATGTGNTAIKTAIYTHYSGVAVSASGTITQVAGDSPTISFAQTANNAGK